MGRRVNDTKDMKDVVAAYVATAGWIPVDAGTFAWTEDGWLDGVRSYSFTSDKGDKELLGPATAVQGLKYWRSEPKTK